MGGRPSSFQLHHDFFTGAGTGVVGAKVVEESCSGLASSTRTSGCTFSLRAVCEPSGDMTAEVETPDGVPEVTDGVGRWEWRDCLSRVRQMCLMSFSSNSLQRGIMVSRL